jgi:F-type H+-transporting ATPase subunit epsilon
VRVEVVSPEQVLYQGEAEMVTARTVAGGDIAFLPNHAPFLGALVTWPVRVVQGDGAEVRVAVHGGFVEVSNNTVTVLTDVAELPEQIDVARARDALARAETELAANPEDEEALVAQMRAQVRIDVATGEPATTGAGH